MRALTIPSGSARTSKSTGYSLMTGASVYGSTVSLSSAEQLNLLELDGSVHHSSGYQPYVINIYFG